MIKRFGFRNFSSFKDGAEINFCYNSSASIEDTVGTVIGIKGANGSGKTNILKALAFLYCFCARRINTRSGSSDSDSQINLPIETYFDNDNITEFYIELLLGDTTYIYELDLTKKGIVREELRRKVKKEVVCITREGNKVVECLSEFDELKSLKLKLDQSVISVVYDFDFHKPMTDLHLIYLNFVKIVFNVGATGYRSYDMDDYFKVSKLYSETPKALEFAKDIISGVDDGVVDIVIEKSIDQNGEIHHYPLFSHSNNDDIFSIGVAHESMGTKSLFLNLYRYWLTISEGGLLVLDEFDTHLHSMILPEIIELFTNKDINKKNAQLIITAHNTEIIDSLGRYRVVLVNKESNESYCYRLDELSMLRNDRSISPLYSKGKIGGVPKSISGLTKRLAKKWERK